MAELLVLCRANLCRSPAVAALLRDALGADSGHTVRSAGLRPVADLEVPGSVADWIAARGLDVRSHRPQGLRRADVDSAALVVVMTRAQRSALVTTFPTALRRTALLTEAADRVRLTPEGGIAVGPSTGTDARDLVDPYGRPDAEVAAILEEAAQEVRRLAAALQPGRSSSLHGVG